MLQSKLDSFHRENPFRPQVIPFDHSQADNLRNNHRDSYRDTGHIQRVLDAIHKKDPVAKNHYQLPFDADTPVGSSFTNTGCI